MIRSETSTQAGGETYPCHTCVRMQATRLDPASLCPQRNEQKRTASLSASKTSDTVPSQGSLRLWGPALQTSHHRRRDPLLATVCDSSAKTSNSLSSFSRCPPRNTQMTVASTAGFRDGVCEALSRFFYSLKPLHFTEVISLKSADCKTRKPRVPHI